MADEICMYCGKQRSDLYPATCPKSSNGRHAYASRAYSAGAKLGDIFTNIIAALFKLLFSKPESVAGIIIRGIVFAVASFFIAAVVIASISNNANLSFVLGVLAGAAVFGLYFWYFGKKLDE